MKDIDKFLGRIPAWLASKVSIFIYIFLFFYLVIFALLAILFPSLHALEPTQNSQLILGNYTNVLSALGASIAAGSGVAIHGKIKALHESHRKLQDTLDELHKKIEHISSADKTDKSGDKTSEGKA